MSTVIEKRKRNKSQADKIDQIDFKMVTFSLAGKDYGIDIMKVKEISKAGRFTYVPNSLPYVRGVYNLRGEIISIIDLRIMFHLPAEKKQEDALENVLILRLDTFVMGVVVDAINKVIGITSESIQPPHQLFSDVNLKYINGVVENNDRLYIILDVERIFSREKEEKKELITASAAAVPDSTESDSFDDTSTDRTLGFIIETLNTFKSFSSTPLNRTWLLARYEEWKQIRAKEKVDVQLKELADAERFLEPFVSPCSASLWSEEYSHHVLSLLEDRSGTSLTVWNPGCGSGHETYSLACVLKNRYPGHRIKIWANDHDLMGISTAPNLVLQKEEIPAMAKDFIVEGRNGFGFAAAIKDLIMFEYHDILHSNPFENLDIIIARDVLSFFRPHEQQKLLEEFHDKLKEEGLLILGTNEQLESSSLWSKCGRGNVSAYRKARHKIPENKH